MASRSMFTLLTAAVLGAPGGAGAQSVSAQVTVQVPVSLTQFGPDVGKVMVSCSIVSDAILTTTSYGLDKQGQPLYGANRTATLSQEIPMTGGSVSATATIVFNFAGLDNPVGKPANAGCNLTGWSLSQQAWAMFTGTTSNLSFKTSGAYVGGINYSFVW